MNELIIEQAIKYIEELFQDNVDGHDTQHSMRVYHNAMMIAEEYPDCDRLVVSLAALLHDADDHKLFDTEHNANARQFLSGQPIGQERVEHICEIMNAVSYSKNKGKAPSTLEGQIVQDADRLDAIGAIGIARTFAYGGKHGRSMELSVQHFHEKLLLLKEQMNMPKAREIAEIRHSFMEQFLREMDDEIHH